MCGVEGCRVLFICRKCFNDNACGEPINPAWDQLWIILAVGRSFSDVIMVTTPNIFPESRSNHGIKVVCACTMQCSAVKLYAFWRQLENLPQVLPSLVSVRQLTRRESHWVAKGPTDEIIEWDAEIVYEEPGQLIAWCTKDGFEPAHAGSVRFEPAALGEGTEVTVSLEYDQPDEKLAPVVTKLFGKDPGSQLAEDLRRVKAFVEAGAMAGGGHYSAKDRRVVALRR